MRRTWTILAALAALLAFAPAARAADFVVNSAVDAGGECAPEQQCTIRQALGSAAALPGADSVTIPAGTYTLTLGALTIASDVTLRGADARTTTIVAAAAARVLEIGAATARVESVTLSGGTATDAGGFHGGNVRNQGGNVVLDRVRVTGGSASSGGGVANRNGTMLIQNSLIDHNSALQGGGDGGGVINFGGDLGAAAALTVHNSTLAFNTARLAGALISYGNVQDRVTLDGVTVARNSGGDRGVGGISFGAGSGVLSARATVVADNLAQGLPSNCGGGQALTSQGSNVESGTECGFALQVDQRGVDALLGTELVNAGGPTDVLLPSPLSPAINVNGDAAACGGIDQRGVTRPKGPRCDAGAVELDYEVRIDTATFAGSGATFAFSSGRSPVLFDCALDRPGGPVAQFGPCSGTAGADYTGLAPGEYTFRVRALVGGAPIGEAPRAFTVVEPETTIVSGPVDFSPRQARFTFSSSDPGAVFECMFLPDDRWFACASPWTSDPLVDGASHTFRVRARTAGGVFDETPAERAFVVDTVDPVLTITAGPSGLTRETNAVFSFTSPDATARFECTHVFPDGSRSTIACESGWNPYDFEDGVHGFEIAAIDRAGNSGRDSRSLTVDTRAPEPVVSSASGSGTFAFEAAEPGASFECRLEGLTDFAPCTSPATFALAPGDYTFELRAVDAAGNRSEPVRRAFTVAAPQPATVPEPVATPRPVATPTPTPRAGETVVARPVSGRILVKRPNSNEFVELSRSDDIPVGSEVNAKNGRVALTIEPGDGRPVQRAVFYAGIFKLSQPGATLDLTLSEPLAACKKNKRASAAQTGKAKTRKLWGDGKGKFRTRGRYSSATVRGTIWLVQDTCEGTLTRVRQGVVSVRDRKKTVLVRAGRSYLAKARR